METVTATDLERARSHARRGSHAAVRRADAEDLCARLVAGNVIPDFRAPDSIRLGLSPLTTTFEEVHAGMARLRELAGA